MDHSEKIVIAIISLQLLWVCYTDIRFRLISNYIVITILFSAIALGIIINKQINIYSALIFLVIGLVIFYFGAIGAGDVKLMSVLTLALNSSQIFNFIFFTAFCGGIIALLGLLFSFTDIRKRGVPYGVAISMGFLASIFTV